MLVSAEKLPRKGADYASVRELSQIVNCRNKAIAQNPSKGSWAGSMSAVAILRQLDSPILEQSNEQGVRSSFAYFRTQYRDSSANPTSVLVCGPSDAPSAWPATLPPGEERR